MPGRKASVSSHNCYPGEAAHATPCPGWFSWARATLSVPMIEDYDAVVAGLQRRGFRLELSADDKSVVRVTSPGGSTLDHPSLDELRHLLRGISIRCLTQQCDQPT